MNKRHFGATTSNGGSGFAPDGRTVGLEPRLDERARRWDNEIEPTNLQTRAAGPNPLGDADFGEVMPKKSKTTRKTKTAKANGAAPTAGKRAGAKAKVAGKAGAVPPGFTLRAECRAHKGAIRLIDWSPDGETLAATVLVGDSDAGTIEIWRGDGQKVIARGGVRLGLWGQVA